MSWTQINDGLYRIITKRIWKALFIRLAQYQSRTYFKILWNIDAIENFAQWCYVWPGLICDYNGRVFVQVIIRQIIHCFFQKCQISRYHSWWKWACDELIKRNQSFLRAIMANHREKKRTDVVDIDYDMKCGIKVPNWMDFFDLQP